MSDLDESIDDLDDPLLRSLARTQDVAPFAGTVRYRVVSCLGEGGFGVVYDVEDRQLGRRIALKRLKPQLSGLAANIHRIKREFRAIADLVHPNLVGVHEMSSDGPIWFFTMDLVCGPDLLTFVRGKSEALLRSSFRQLVDGVCALHHAGLVHRDLKPSNVLVHEDGRVVILDFGLAGGDPVDDEVIRFAGTPAYMAPERGITPAADWYAVGVMLYEALAGALPSTGDQRIGLQRHNVPADLATLTLALLRREPQQRPGGDAIVEVLGGSAVAGGSRRLESRTFVGRAAELDVLRRGVAMARQRVPAVIQLRGEPGVGKSALLARFIDGVRESADVLVLEGRCHERESVPFKGFDGIADALVRYVRRLPRHEAVGLMPRDIHLVAQLFPVFDGVAAVHDVPQRHSPPADPREARARAFAAIKELVARLADKQPLVIAIDDLQWGDVDSARLLAQLVAPPERPALLLVICFRSEEAERSETLGETLRTLDAAGAAAVTITLERLPRPDAEILAAALLRGEDRPTDAARTIAERGEGHPLFIEELVRSGSDENPSTLMDMLWQRVARLSDGARALLETIATAGQPLSANLCFEAAGLGSAGVEHVRVLRAERLVRAGEDGDLNVFHDRVRDAVLARTDGGAQRSRHLALAQRLERIAGSDPEEVARHFDAAGEREPAARYALRAADSAMSVLAFERAAALYQIAVDRSEQASSTLYEKLGHAHLNAGCNSAAGDAFLAAAARVDKTDPRATKLTSLAAEQLLFVGDIKRGHEAVGQALAAVGAAKPSLRGAMFSIVSHMMLVRVGLRGRRLHERSDSGIAPERLLRLDVFDSCANGLERIDPMQAMALRARFSRLAFKIGEPRRAALGLIASVMYVMQNQTARPALVDELLDAADAIGHRLGDPRILAKSLFKRGMSHFLFNNFERAVEVYERAAALASEQCVGMAYDVRQGLLNAAASLIKLGQFAAAQRIAEPLLLDAVERRDWPTEKQVSGGALASIKLAADDVAAARTFLDRVQHELRCPSVILRSEANAAFYMYTDLPREAVRSWREEWSRIVAMGGLGVPTIRMNTLRSYACALLAAPESRRDIREAAKWFRALRGHHDSYALAARATIQALLAQHDDAAAASTSLLGDAARHYDAAGMRLHAAACRYRCAELLGDTAARTTADHVLGTNGVVCPERWVSTIVPAIQRL